LAVVHPDPGAKRCTHSLAHTVNDTSAIEARDDARECQGPEKASARITIDRIHACGKQPNSNLSSLGLWGWDLADAKHVARWSSRVIESRLHDRFLLFK
jgi:hypothetical protein